MVTTNIWGYKLDKNNYFIALDPSKLKGKAAEGARLESL